MCLEKEEEGGTTSKQLAVDSEEGTGGTRGEEDSHHNTKDSRTFKEKPQTTTSKTLPLPPK